MLFLKLLIPKLRIVYDKKKLDSVEFLSVLILWLCVILILISKSLYFN